MINKSLIIFKPSQWRCFARRSKRECGLNRNVIFRSFSFGEVDRSCYMFCFRFDNFWKEQRVFLVYYLGDIPNILNVPTARLSHTQSQIQTLAPTRDKTQKLISPRSLIPSVYAFVDAASETHFNWTFFLVSHTLGNTNEQKITELFSFPSIS